MERIILYFLVSLCVLTACSENEQPEIKIPAPRTVLVYLAADNSLGAGSNGFDTQNIASMLKGATSQNLNNSNLVVYLAPNSKTNHPQLMQITAKGKVIKREYVNQNSASPETLREIIQTTKELFPADSYGLIMWSHGSNWFPSDITNTKSSRAIIQDVSHNSWLEMEDLQQAIPENMFDFILFDACYMGGVEVMYAMKNKAEYIMASAAEVMGAGFPYERIVSDLFSSADKETYLKKICDNFYDYYQNDPHNAYNPYGTIALVKTSALPELASATNQILKTSFDKTEAINLSSLQRYFRPTFYNMYDFEDYISRIATEEQLSTFKTSLDKAVIYKLKTSQFLFPINKYCGLSCFVVTSRYPDANKRYEEQDWFKAAYQDIAIGF